MKCNNKFIYHNFPNITFKLHDFQRLTGFKAAFRRKRHRAEETSGFDAHKPTELVVGQVGNRFGRFLARIPQNGVGKIAFDHGNGLFGGDELVNRRRLGVESRDGAADRHRGVFSRRDVFVSFGDEGRTFETDDAASAGVVDSEVRVEEQFETERFIFTWVGNSDFRLEAFLP